MLRLSIAFENNADGILGAAGREHSRRAGRFDTGDVREARNQLLEKAACFLLLRELHLRQADAEGECVARIHSEIGILDRHEAAEHQAGADQERERERDFGDDEDVAHALRFSAGCANATAFLQCIDQLRLRCLQRGKQSEDDARENAGREREHEDAPVELEANPERKFAGNRRDHQVDAPDSEDQTEDAAGESEHQAFREQAADDCTAARAERATHRDFTRPRRAAGEEKIRDVRARDQVHEDHRRHDEQDKVFTFLRHLLAVVFDAQV